MSMSASLLRRAIELYREGKKDQANLLLKTVVRQEPSNQIAWNWYIETLCDPHERMRALEEYLLIYPDSRPAAKTLSALKQKLTPQPVPVDLPATFPIAPAKQPASTFSQPRQQAAIIPRSRVTASLKTVPTKAERRGISLAPIISVASIVLLAALFVYAFRLQQDRDALQGHFDTLQASYYDLQIVHEVTVQEKALLKTQLDDLWVDYDYLDTVYQALSSAYSDLELRFNDLASTFIGLQNQHTALLQEHEALKGSYSDLKSKFGELSTQYDQLRENYTYLYGWYEWLDHNAVKPPYIAIHNRLVTLGFYGPYGNVETWTKDVSELENAIATGQYYRENPTFLTFEVNGEKLEGENLAPFIDPQPFKDYITSLYARSGSDYEFIQNIRAIISQLTIYNWEYYEIPRHPLETFLLGGGDCEDTSILLASMLLAAPVDWEVSLVFLDSINPQDAQTINHVIVYVNTGSAEYLIESTDPDKFWGFDTERWQLDVTNLR